MALSVSDLPVTALSLMASSAEHLLMFVICMRTCPVTDLFVYGCAVGIILASKAGTATPGT